MEQFTVSTLSSYRTQLLGERQAEAFARCLRGNSRFSDIRVCHSARAKGAKQWYVSYAASNLARREALLNRHQNERARRACEETFTFVLDTDASRPFYWCLSHRSQEVYKVDEHSCSCPDHLYRTGPASLKCKHILALMNTSPEDIHGFEPVPNHQIVYSVTPHANLCARCAAVYGLPTGQAPRVAAACDDCGQGGRAKGEGRRAKEGEERRAEEEATFNRLFGDTNEDWLR